MSHDAKDSGYRPASADGDPDPQFVDEFQAAIGSLAEAAAMGKTQETQDSALKAFRMAREQALKQSLLRMTPP